MNLKNVAISLCGALVFFAAAFGTGAASPPKVTGTWQIEQSGANGSTVTVIKLTQSGDTIVGTNAANGNGFTGTFVTDTQVNGKWHGPGGAGWLTVYVSANGHSLNGTWGYNGTKPNGSFVGNKVLPPSPITAKGSWNVVGAGGPTAFLGNMRCTQSGPTVVCKVGGYALNGKFRTKDKVRATWTGPGGSGWFSFWFNGDNNSFNGLWGKGAETTPPVGRVIGQRTL
jgi:hypothetical protein